MPYIDGILIPYAPPGQQACAAILAALDARDLPRPAVTSSVVTDLGHGFVDCPYCKRFHVPRTNPAQSTCGRAGCDAKRRQWNSKRYYRKGRKGR